MFRYSSQLPDQPDKSRVDETHGHGSQTFASLAAPVPSGCHRITSLPPMLNWSIKLPGIGSPGAHIASRASAQPVLSSRDVQ
jgi:hypothetical protein